MPLFAISTSAVAPRPQHMRVDYAYHPDLSSVFGGLAVRSGRAYNTQAEFASAMAISRAARAIEECYATTDPSDCLPKKRNRMLRSFVERTVRHARRVINSTKQYNIAEGSRQLKQQLALLEHTVQILRREVIRAMRHGQLMLRWPSGETSQPNKLTLRGTKSGLAPFINRACYAVTRELGCFALPFLPLSPKNSASDIKVDSFWSSAGLGIWWDDGSGWMVESTQEIGSSEVSTEVEEERMAEDLEESKQEEEEEPKITNLRLRTKLQHPVFTPVRE